VGTVETVQRIYEAFGAGDVPAILELLADDVEWEQWEDNRAVASVVRLRHYVDTAKHIAAFGGES